MSRVLQALIVVLLGLLAWLGLRTAEATSEPTPLDVTSLTSQTTTAMRSTSYVLECGDATHRISPLIYGLAGDDDVVWATGATARRWGGNPTTRYNWEMNYWNKGKDWFFKNTEGPEGGYNAFLAKNRDRRVAGALEIPMIGWVAKNSTSYAFPVSKLGPQQFTAWDSPDAGNGVGPDGKMLAPPPPTQTSIPAPPEFIERWVRTIVEKQKSGRLVDQYILDNEPSLWNSTHRDVHPDGTTYDELLEKTIAYASAIRRADPDATIAGPAEWGWLGYQYSGRDVALGVRLRPDRRLHGDEPLLPWYLKKIAEYEKANNTRILDVVDVHFYPMGDGVGIGTNGRTDAATAALRIRSTRSLWDPTYLDESWINEKMHVIPLVREWIAANHPGLGISIGEWNFGAESHMSGGLATAEALGRFGTEGITSAFYWTSPVQWSPAFWAFRAFRNFDGKGGRFQDSSVPVTGNDPLASLFGSRDVEDKRVVAILLNFAPATSLDATVDVTTCGGASSVRAFTYTGGDVGFKPMDVSATGGKIAAKVDPYSMTVLDVTPGARP